MNTIPPPASLIHGVVFLVNFCTRPKFVLIFILVVSSFFSHRAQAVNVVIEGTSTFVCPSKSVTYSARTFEETFGVEIFSCSIHWQVFEGNEVVGQGTGVNFTYTFPDVGLYQIKVVANGCGIFFDSGEKIVSTTSRVPIPSPISGPAMCNSGQSYSYTSSPTLNVIFPVGGNCYYHYPYRWEAPEGWSINGGGNIVEHNETVNIVAPAGTPSGSYIISVQGMIPKPSSSDFWYSQKRNFSVQIGPFNQTQVSVSGSGMVCNGNSYTYTANVPTGHQSGYTYNWTYPSGWSVQNTSNNTITFFLPSSNNTYGPVRVSVNNGCGATHLTGITVMPCSYMYSSGDFIIYPNPSDGELFVEYDVNDNRALERLDGEPQHKVSKPRTLVFKVNVFDRTEKLVRTGVSKENKVFVDTRGLQTGTYFLHIYAGDQVVRKQIIVKN
ncbi:T9SS type A sorting domain-containing protein [Fontibacter flavus]|uniref:T9SS type A sorting domain-containing protein n=1 Tax=Fontibacter flavus TaxID=654838 RepID=A0ABV6FU20_9BACT